MKIEEYLQLLSEGKVDEARRVRFSTIPSKLMQETGYRQWKRWMRFFHIWTKI